MAPKRHRLDITAIDALSVTVYQRSPSGTRYLLKTCVCSRNQPVAGNWRCRPCRVRTKARLGGRDASRPARVEIKVVFRHPVNPHIPAAEGLQAQQGSPPITKYYVTYLASDQTREYRLNPADYVESNEPTTSALAGLPQRKTLTQATVPQARLPQATLVEVFETPTVQVLPGITGSATLTPPEVVIDAGDIAEGMADGSSIETDIPADLPDTTAQDEGVTQDFVYPVAGYVAGMAASRFLQITPLVGGFLGAAAGYFLGQDHDS